MFLQRSNLLPYTIQNVRRIHERFSGAYARDRSQSEISHKHGSGSQRQRNFGNLIFKNDLPYLSWLRYCTSMSSRTYAPELQLHRDLQALWLHPVIFKCLRSHEGNCVWKYSGHKRLTISSNFGYCKMFKLTYSSNSVTKRLRMCIQAENCQVRHLL